MDKQSDLLILGLRWLAHDLANPLSVLHSGLEMKADDLAHQGAEQLVGLIRCLQLIGADGGASSATLPDHFHDSLQKVAAARNIVLNFHDYSPPLAHAIPITALCLAMFPRMITGEITFIPNNTKLTLKASGLSGKGASVFQESLVQPSPTKPDHIPFYIARSTTTSIEASSEGDLFTIEISF